MAAHDSRMLKLRRPEYLKRMELHVEIRRMDHRCNFQYYLEKKSLSLKVEVPFQVNKGIYQFKILAGSLYSLPLVVIVSEKGTFKTEFTTKQANMEGHANSTFTFNAGFKKPNSRQAVIRIDGTGAKGLECYIQSECQTGNISQKLKQTVIQA